MKERDHPSEANLHTTKHQFLSILDQHQFLSILNTGITTVTVHGSDESYPTEESTSEGYSQPLLYIHQETTRYDLALFFTVVVAEFVTQSETAEHIGEALAILKEWNPA